MLSSNDKLISRLKIINRFLLVIAILFTPLNTYAQKFTPISENWTILTDTIPCHLNIKLRGVITREPSASDSQYFIGKKIKRFSKKYYQADTNILLLDYGHLLYFRLNPLFGNTSDLDTISLYNVTFALNFELFMRKRNRLIPVKVDESCGMQIAFPAVAPHQTDSSFYMGLMTDLAKLDTGDYIVRGVYRQKCKNTVKVIHTNEVRFHLID